MYLKKVLFAVVVLTIGFSNAYELRRIDECNIHLKKEELLKELQCNRLKKSCLIGVLTVAGGVCAYKLLFSNQKTDDPIVPIDNLSVLSGIDLYTHQLTEQEEIFTRAALYSELLAKATRKAPSIFSKVYRKFGTVFEAVGINVAVSIVLPFFSPFQKITSRVASAIDRIFDNKDLQWYLDTHTNLSDLFHSLNGKAKILADGKIIGIDDEQAYQNELVNLWNCLIDQCEGVLSFIDYQTSKASIGDPSIFRENLIYMLNQKTSKLERNLEDNNSCLELIEEVNSRLHFSLESFKTLFSVH